MPYVRKDMGMGKRLRMDNGDVIDATKPLIRLDCSECEAYTSFDQQSATVVYCAECGKKHSNESLVDVNTPGIDL